MRSAELAIEALRTQAAAGEITLAYLDEAGFSQIHPNRNAWTPKGKQHLIEATRGRRLNVLAAMLSTGKLISAKLWQPTTSDAFVGFLGILQQAVTTPLTIILDNASIHKAKAADHIVQWLQQRGVTLFFLPPYSPELNKIERLWHMIKHIWMAPKCRNAATLEADIDEIINNFGSKYKFAF